MGVYKELLDSVISLIDTNLSLYATVTVGSLPVSNGISAYLGPGAPTESHLDRGSINEIYVVVNAKHADQNTALDALSDIHTYLTRLKTYPGGTNWQMLNIETGTAPNYIGTEDNGSQYLYGSILKVKIYIGGVE